MLDQVDWSALTSSQWGLADPARRQCCSSRESRTHGLGHRFIAARKMASCVDGKRVDPITDGFVEQWSTLEKSADEEVLEDHCRPEACTVRVVGGSLIGGPVPAQRILACSVTTSAQPLVHAEACRKPGTIPFPVHAKQAPRWALMEDPGIRPQSRRPPILPGRPRL